MPSVSASRWVPHPPERVWELVGDVGGYGRFTNGITTRVLRGDGADAVRECRDDNGRWAEDVVHWDEGRSYTMRVRTDAPDYPFPVRAMTGSWGVEPEGAGARIRLRFTVRPRGLRGWVWLLGQLRGGGKATEDLLDAYEAELDGRGPGGD